MNKIKRQELIEFLQENSYKAHQLLTPLLNSGYLYKELYLNLLTTLIFDELKLKVNEPFSPDRDRLLLYNYQLLPLASAIASIFGFFSKEQFYKNIELWDPLVVNFEDKSKLNKGAGFFDIPGIDLVSDDITRIFYYAIGLAISSKISRFDYNVYIIGDKENLTDPKLMHIISGLINYNLSNLIFIVDIEGIEDNVFLHKWFKAGWYILEKKGYDFNNILDLLKGVLTSKGQPILLLLS